MYHYSFRGSFNVSSGLWTAEAKFSSRQPAVHILAATARIWRGQPRRRCFGAETLEASDPEQSSDGQTIRKRCFSPYRE